MELQNFCVVSWLLYNCREDHEKSTTIDFLYQSYKDYCLNQNIFPATLDYFSKALEKVLPYAKRRYPRESRSLHDGNRGSLIPTLDGLSFEPTNDGVCPAEMQQLVLPEYCVIDALSTQLPLLLRFSVPTLYTVNGINVIIDVNIQDSVLSLQIGILNVELDILDFSTHCPVDQNHVDGVVRLAQMMKLCRGKPYNPELPYPASAMAPEDWNLIGNHQSHVEKRVRFKACKSVVGVNARTDTCIKCQAGQKRLTFHKRHNKAQADKENLPPTASTAIDVDTMLLSSAYQTVRHTEHAAKDLEFDTQSAKVDTPPAEVDTPPAEVDTPPAEVDTPPAAFNNKKVSACDSSTQSSSTEESCTDEDMYMYGEPSATNLQLEEGAVTLTKDDDLDMEAIVHKVMPHVPPGFQDLLRSQLRNGREGKDPRGRRWDSKIISTCLGLYCRAPKAYDNLKQSGLMVLPSDRLLRYYKNAVNQQQGFVEDNLVWMKQEAARTKVPAAGHRGILLLDEMQIQEDLQIKKQGDAWEIVGVVDLGNTSNNLDILMNKKRQSKLATHILQFAFAGFTGFRWPVAYFASATATTHQLYLNIWEAIDILDDYGFQVDCVMMDGASTNRSLCKMVLGGTRPSTYLATNLFDPSETVAFTQDVKHCFKKIRNGVESSRLENKKGNGRCLQLNGKYIVWDHWMAAAEFNVQGGFRVHKRLTEEHIELTSTSKMRNKLATDVLDRNMLRLMKEYSKTLKDPEELASTLQFLENTSIAVDIFLDVNRPVTSMSDVRMQQLREVVEFFNTWESQIVTKKLNQQKHLLTQETRDDLNSAILGFTAVCEKLVTELCSVRPGYFNSDLIENVFCQQRGICHGACTNPTVNQYGPAVNSIVLGQLSTSRKSNASGKTLHFGATVSKPLRVRSRKRDSLNSSNNVPKPKKPRLRV